MRFIFLAFLVACSGKAFTKGEYDDPSRIALLDDKFNEADMQQIADHIVKSLVSCPYVAKAKAPPILMMKQIQNRTSEHIDMKMITDKIQTAILKSRQARFVNEEAREALEKEYEYNESGFVSGPTQKKKGKQIGVDYIVSGRMSSNVQQVGNEKLIYYKVTVNLTNVDTSIIDCTEEEEIRKKFRKRTIGF